MTNCGAGDGGESCCTSLEVMGGTYYRTYTSDDAGSPTGEADPATVSSFRLDKYLVTVGRFRQFVDAVLLPDGGLSWTPPAGSGKHTHLNGGLGLASAPNVDAGQIYEPGWVASDDSNIAPTNINLTSGLCTANATWTDSPSSQENLPINCVIWAEAYAFCIWDGGFLPSESEWEYAAAGGSQQLEYPWGSTAPGTGNQYAIYGGYYTGNSTDIAPVGFATLGVGVWGQLDLAGELWEWNLDWYEGGYADPCTDCVQLNPMSYCRVGRGGIFDSPASYLLSTNRVESYPTYAMPVGGFRCARTP
jgi:formylglycine-generating enzyme